MSKTTINVDEVLDVLGDLGDGPEEVSLADVSRLLSSLSTDSHEARLEIYSIDEGCALCFSMVPRDAMAPDFIRKRPASRALN